MGLLAFVAPRGLSAWPEPVVGLVESPARPAAARHISLTRVLMSVKPRDSRPAARLQLEPLCKRKGKMEVWEGGIVISNQIFNPMTQSVIMCLVLMKTT